MCEEIGKKHRELSKVMKMFPIVIALMVSYTGIYSCQNFWDFTLKMAIFYCMEVTLHVTKLREKMPKTWS